MREIRKVFRQWLCVTVGAALLLGAAFLLYFFLFALLERLANTDRNYAYVSYLRIGYGALWFVVCPLAYRMRMPDCLKACILAAGLSAFLIALSVQLYDVPWLYMTVSAIPVLSGVIALTLRRSPWYHYYALLLVIVAVVIYQ